MPYQASYAAVIATAFGLVGTAYCAYRYYQTVSQVKVPTKWRRVGSLKQIYMYPVKSCGGVVVDNGYCTLLGMKKGWLLDRNLMVVDESYNFATARTHPELFQAKPSVNDSVLTLEHPVLDTITVDLAEVKANQKLIKATVWFSEVLVYDCGFKASQWFTKLINKPPNTYQTTRLINKPPNTYHLVYYASEKTRTSVDPRNKYFKFAKNDLGAFHDDASFNLINEASIVDLNSRFDNCKVSALQFRPNFIISGGVPYDEDTWSFIKIGDNVFEIVRPCIRCTMTTLDPDTGTRNPQNEPINTLKKYRQFENEEIRQAFREAPRMGVQVALRTKPGATVSMHDSVYVA